MEGGPPTNPTEWVEKGPGTWITGAQCGTTFGFEWSCHSALNLLGRVVSTLASTAPQHCIRDGHLTSAPARRTHDRIMPGPPAPSPGAPNAPVRRSCNPPSTTLGLPRPARHLQAACQPTNNNREGGGTETSAVEHLRGPSLLSPERGCHGNNKTWAAARPAGLKPARTG